MKEAKAYLAGPMTGIPEFNYPEFHRAARGLRDLDYEVTNPAENFGGDMTLDWNTYLRTAVAQVAACEILIVLRGWEKSKGANLEVTIARALGMPVIQEWDMKPAGAAEPTETILQEAQRLVHGDRGADYGHPLLDYERTAKIWSAIIGHEITAEQAILCMIGMKLSRECNKHKRDNLTDAAGYAECLSMVHDERARRKALS